MSRLIGIVGGIDPRSGELLHSAIVTNTRAAADSDHLPIVLYTNPGITDPAGFLQDETKESPADEVLVSLRQLVHFGATVLCVPSSAIGADAIWQPIEDGLQEFGEDTDLLSVIDVTVHSLVHRYPEVSHVGVIAPAATISSAVYQQALENHNVTTIVPTDTNQRRINEAIQHPDWGIKVQVNPISDQAGDLLETAGLRMIADGAEAIIIGSAQLAPSVDHLYLKDVPVVDSMNALARAAIRHAADERKLRPRSD